MNQERKPNVEALVEKVQESLGKALKPLRGRTIDSELRRLATEIVTDVLMEHLPETPQGQAIRLLSDMVTAMFQGAPGVIVQKIKKAEDAVLQCLMDMGAGGFGGLGQLVGAEVATRAGQLKGWNAVQEGPGVLKLTIEPVKGVEWIELECEVVGQEGKGVDSRGPNS